MAQSCPSQIVLQGSELATDAQAHRECGDGHTSDQDDEQVAVYEEEVFSDGEDMDYADGEEASEAHFSQQRLAELEEEQEQLNTSLIALTSHFAQVQLRLKQIVLAESTEKEKLLKELEEFAFRGIPDLREPHIEDWQLAIPEAGGGGGQGGADERGVPDGTVQTNNNNGSGEVSKLELQRIRQKELIGKLKDQLEDLEKYAYETGDSAIPSSMLLERQSVVIEQLKGKLPLNLEEMEKLSPEELRMHVDKAVRDIVNPAIMKEQLVEQLKTQVTDLERFIYYLQVANSGGGGAGKCGCHKGGKCGASSSSCTCSCPMHGNAQTGLDKYDPVVAAERCKNFKNSSKSPGARPRRFSEDDNGNQEAIKIIKRVMTLLQMITFAQFGCNRNERSRFERNTLKKTTKGNHWGDLRARLELAIEHIVEIDKEKFANDSDYTSDSDESQLGHSHHVQGNEKMTTAVRKELAVALRDLLEHGLAVHPSGQASLAGQSMIVSSLFDWGCFSAKSSQIPTSNSSSRSTMSAWDLVVKFYDFKNGGVYRASPARRLSQSFNLHIVGGVAITPKQTLLMAVDEIIETHTPLKRSPDSHFKAFVCQALNDGKLVTWLKLLVKSRKIVETFYEPWSYVASTGFDDSLRSLDRLTGLKFFLPTDLAVRQLKNISEAF